MTTPAPYHGFDTETQAGRAVLLATEAASCAFPASLRAAWDWLRAQGARFVAWNLDYDARALLLLAPRTLREWRRLHYLNWATLGGVRVTYLPGKRLTLGNGRRKVAIYDAQQFYGGGLDATARRVLGAAGKLAIPRAWLPRMGDVLTAGGRRAARIDAYCRHDAGLALQLWAHVDRQYQAAGVAVAEPLSPAYIAGRHFRARWRWRLSPPEQDVFRESYYGGRIELWRAGRVGPWRSHDIRAAYPAALATLPDPSAAQFVERVGASLRPDPDAWYGAYYCRLHVPRETPVPPFPLRTPRGLAYPTGRWAGWIDGETLRAYPAHVERIERASELIGDGAARPLLPEMAELFAERERRPSVRLALKLLMNSTYGKLCQRLILYTPAATVDDATLWIGDAPYAPTVRLARSTHFAVAAAVTARCRIALQRAAALAPERVVALATDAVYWAGTRRIPGLVTGQGLGAWDEGEAGSDSVWVQPGVYTLRRAGAWHDRTRGFHSRRALLDALDTRRREARLPVLDAETLGQAVARGATAALNILKPLAKVLDPNTDYKRAWPGRWPCARALLDSEKRSRPLHLDSADPAE